MIITVYGENARHEMLLLKPGCVSWAHLAFSEKYIRGSDEDLSPAGTDLTSGGKVHLLVKDKHACLTVNDRPLFDVAYHQPIGKLYGIRISFAGIGSVRSVSLKKPDGSVVFAEGKNG